MALPCPPSPTRKESRISLSSHSEGNVPQRGRPRFDGKLTVCRVFQRHFLLPLEICIQLGCKFYKFCVCREVIAVYAGSRDKFGIAKVMIFWPSQSNEDGCSECNIVADDVIHTQALTSTLQVLFACIVSRPQCSCWNQTSGLVFCWHCKIYPLAFKKSFVKVIFKQAAFTARNIDLFF